MSATPVTVYASSGPAPNPNERRSKLLQLGSLRDICKFHELGVGRGNPLQIARRELRCPGVTRAGMRQNSLLMQPVRGHMAVKRGIRGCGLRRVYQNNIETRTGYIDLGRVRAHIGATNDVSPLLSADFCRGSGSLLRRGIGRFSGTQLEFPKPFGFVLAVNDATLETE